MFRNQVFIIVGSLAATAALLIVLALAMQKGIGDDGILVASSGYWYRVPEAVDRGESAAVPQPDGDGVSPGAGSSSG